MLIFPTPAKQSISPGTSGASFNTTPSYQVTEEGIAPEGFHLSIGGDKILLRHRDEAGKFYGLQCLEQIRSQCDGSHFPEAEIEDAPRLPVRGFMLDISRCRVPTMETLQRLVRLLALARCNQLQLYTEHTFAYSQHPLVWGDASPLTGEEIRELDAYCRDHHIELVPNQNSFGHFERWFRYPEYQHLAECPKGFKHPSGTFRPIGTTLRPTSESLEFISGLYDELLPNFSSTQLNVGGDEPWELGQGFSKERVERDGKQAVYLEFMNRIFELVSARGKSMQFWADIILESPEKLDQVPSESVPVIWGYEDDHPFEKQCTQVAGAGFSRFLVAPGTSVWNSLTGRWNIALGNLIAAVNAAIKHGAQGVLNTSWGDQGHHYEWAYMVPPVLAGGALAWNPDTFSEEGLIEAMNRYVFQDSTGNLARALLKVGGIEPLFGNKRFNNSYLFISLIHDDSHVKELCSKLSKEDFRRIEKLLETERGTILTSSPRSDDADWLREETLIGIDLSLAALTRAAHLVHPELPPLDRSRIRKLIGRFENSWLQRNRPGGLFESSRRLRHPYFPEDNLVS